MKFAKFAIAAVLMTMLVGATATAAEASPRRSHASHVGKASAGKTAVAKRTHHKKAPKHRHRHHAAAHPHGRHGHR